LASEIDYSDAKSIISQINSKNFTRSRYKPKVKNSFTIANIK